MYADTNIILTNLKINFFATYDNFLDGGSYFKISKFILDIKYVYFFIYFIVGIIACSI